MVIALMAVCFFVVITYVDDHGWVDDDTRMDRCIDLRMARFEVLARHGDPDHPTSRADLRTFDYSRDEVRTFCEMDLANGNLNHNGGVKR